MDPVVLRSILALASMAAVFGAILAIASKVFAVHRDPKVLDIVEALPGANCGACGFPGCQGYAEAAVAAGALPSACPPGGNDVAKRVAEILGSDAGEHVAKIAVVHCEFVQTVNHLTHRLTPRTVGIALCEERHRT